LILSLAQSKVSHNLPKLTASILKAIPIKAKHVFSSVKVTHKTVIFAHIKAKLAHKRLKPDLSRVKVARKTAKVRFSRVSGRGSSKKGWSKALN
jgi:hypothetical protein